jgi:hypothetical protein
MDLSIIITAFDGGRLLRDAVESVLAQTAPEGYQLPVMEVILVYDREIRPKTAEVVEDTRRRHPEVRVTKNRHRRAGAAIGTPGSTRRGGSGLRSWTATTPGSPAPSTPAGAHCATIRTRAGWRPDFMRAPDLELTPPGSAFTRDNAHLRALMGHPHDVPGGPFDNGSPFRLARPVAEFCQASLCWTGTVMVRRDLLLGVGRYHERLVHGSCC